MRPRLKKDKFYKMIHENGYTVITQVVGILSKRDDENKVEFHDLFVSDDYNAALSETWTDWETTVESYFPEVEEIDITEYPEYLL